MRVRPLISLALAGYALSATPLKSQQANRDQTPPPSDAKAADLTLPETTGPYKVGRASYHLVDSSRKEVFADAPGAVREIMAAIHYPAQLRMAQTAAPYADGTLAAALSAAYHISPLVFASLHSHAVDKPPCTAPEGGFPVVLFSPGFKSHPLFYTAIIEELASQGFVVVSLCHPYSTGATVFPDGRVVRANKAGTKFELHKGNNVDYRTMVKERDAIGEVWVADVRSVLDWLAGLNRNDKLLAGCLDLSRVGVFGHSFGGATAAAAVERDPRFRAGINLDGSDFSTTSGERIGERFLWLCSERPDLSKLPQPKLGQGRGPEPGDVPLLSKDRPPASVNTVPGVPIVQEDSRDPSLPPRDRARAPRVDDGMRGPASSHITIKGSRHQTFESDLVLLKATPSLRRFVLGGATGTIEGHRAVTIVNAIVVGFFRKYLARETVTFLDDPSSKFPEAIRGDARSSPAVIQTPRAETPK
jgi:dienelactone hydrolase